MIEKHVKPQILITSTRQKPKVIKWKSITMIRNQSFLATVREIIDYSDEMDVTRIGIVGDMHSGKSTLALSLGHAIHTYSKIPFAVRVFYRDDLKNFKVTISKLNAANYVLIFDDISFIKDTAQIEQEVSEIRHMPGGQDVKIILIFNFHYPKALPPFLREFQFKFITSVGTDNEKVIVDNYGKNNLDRIINFKIIRKKAIIQKFWLEQISRSESIKMNWRNPFIPVLFWNEASMRKIVTPTRYFMKEICSECEEAIGNKTYDEKSLTEILAVGDAKFGTRVIDSAVRILLYVNGMTTYSGSITRAIRWIQNERKIRNLPLTAIAVERGLSITKTYLRTKPYQETDLVVNS